MQGFEVARFRPIPVTFLCHTSLIHSSSLHQDILLLGARRENVIVRPGPRSYILSQHTALIPSIVFN